MGNLTLGNRNTENESVIRWVEAQAKLCQPDKIYWCDGSEMEKEALTAEAVAQGVLIKLNQEKLPGCYYHRSNPNDVARVEQCTFICTPMQEEAGPTNNWMAPKAFSQRTMHGSGAPCRSSRPIFSRASRTAWSCVFRLLYKECRRC